MYIRMIEIVPGFFLEHDSDGNHWQIIYEHHEEVIACFDKTDICSQKNGHASFWKAVGLLNEKIRLHPMTGYQLVKASVSAGWQPAFDGEGYTNWLMEKIYYHIYH
jgi:hypothetical protein